MNEDFKEKLKAYTEGRLSEEEKLLMEEELQKLEIYQEFLDEQLDINASSQNTNNSNIVKNADKIIKRGKWRARFQNAFIALSLFFVLLMVFQTVTSNYYNLGSPSKSSLYENVMWTALQTTRPNINITGNSFSSGIFFSRNIEISYSKKVGGQEYGHGAVTLKFNFNKPKIIADEFPNSSNSITFFINPNLKESEKKAWNTLDKLPEGTVSEAYLTLGRLYETDEILKKFENKDLSLLWLGVDTGLSRSETYTIDGVLGFPNTTFTPRLYGKKPSTNPTELNPFGDGKQRNENFINALEFLNKYKDITKQIAPSSDIQSALDYVNKNGVKIFGVVVTGPTKEILKLKDDGFVSGINVGETRLWNWN